MRDLLKGKRGFTVTGDMSEVAAAITAIVASNPEVVLVGLSGRAQLRLLTAVNRRVAAGHPVRTTVLMDAISPGMPHRRRSSALRSPPAERAVQDDAPRKPEARRALTTRQLEIVRGVCRGDSNETIARQLSIRLDTVKHHLTHIFAKLGVSTRLQLALFAVDHAARDRAR